MFHTYYTLRALAEEWNALWRGARIGDAFSQARGELTIGLTDGEREWMLRILTAGSLRAVFSTDRFSRARRNSVTLFEQALGREVEAVRTAERDRMLFVDLSGDLRVQVLLFGPRPNAYLTDVEGRVVQSFKSDDRWAGRDAPAPRAAPLVDTFGDFAERWNASGSSAEKALARALPLFDRTLAAEALHRAGLPKAADAARTEAELRAIFDAARGLEQALEHPAPCLYWEHAFPEAFALIPLEHLAHLRVERFDTVRSAAGIFVRRTLAHQRFSELYRPLHRGLDASARRYRESAERMLEEVTRPSRAERYEHWGHLLMAHPDSSPMGTEEIELDDLFEEGARVTIPVEAGLSSIENAERYYEKARRTRQRRLHAEERLDDVQRRADAAERLLERLKAIETLPELEAFRTQEADALATYTGSEAAGTESVPFRRYTVHGGYEVWVGRNARQNDELTLRRARKYDLWMHARGVPGSHVVLRLPNRHAQPDRRAVEQAAAIAAYWSEARTSRLAPVQVTERKYVRKPKGSLPGRVALTREEVVLVEPGLPA